MSMPDSPSSRTTVVPVPALRCPAWCVTPHTGEHHPGNEFGCHCSAEYGGSVVLGRTDEAYLDRDGILTVTQGEVTVFIVDSTLDVQAARRVAAGLPLALAAHDADATAVR